MGRSFLMLIIALVVISVVSCNKEEGTGGEGSIKGVVTVKEIDRIYKSVLSTGPAKDFDVYVKYGNSNTVGDRIRTSPDGSFEFKYLQDGDYKIYVYSDDTASLDKNLIAIEKPVTVKNGKTSTIDTFVVFKGRDIDNGTSSISGRIYVYNFKKDGVTLSGQYWAQDVEVYLIYGDKTDYDIRVRTSYDGSFVFPNLIKGKYKIFVYTAHRNADGDLDGFNEDSVIIKEVVISSDNQKVNLGQINTEKL